MPSAYRALRSGWLRAERSKRRQMPGVRCTSKPRSEVYHEKSFSHTRGWLDSGNRRGREPDDGGRSMASSSWLSRCSRCRRLGSRSPPRRRARINSTKALLQLCVRTRLFWAAVLRPARTLLGRMGLAHSSCRRLLLTFCAFSSSGKEELASGDVWLPFAADRQMSGQAGRRQRRSMSGRC
jgi:hypothetical protein